MSEALSQRQAAFLNAILDEQAPLPQGWGNSQSVGMNVYRGNYRSAVVKALESTFERTARYVGEEPFKQVCIHHAIAHPPVGWTIDEAGAGFDATCGELFANNPEVAELAWLEWTMQQVASAPDINPLDQSAFASAAAGFADEDWMNLRLEFQPRAAAREVRADLSGLWTALEDEAESERPAPLLEIPKGCIVSREGERPVFQMVAPDMANGFARMQNGATYGEMMLWLAGEAPDADAISTAAMRAGAMMGEWINEGLVIDINA